MDDDTINNVEALLIATVNPLSKSEISEALRMDQKDVKKAIKNLEKRYQNTALEVKLLGKKYKIGVKDKYSEISFKYSESELNKGELEIIGLLYSRKNVYFSSVERLRGKRAETELDHLKKIGYIEIEQKGTRRLLKLTKLFYQKYGKALKEKMEEENKVVS